MIVIGGKNNYGRLFSETDTQIKKIKNNVFLIQKIFK